MLADRVRTIAAKGSFRSPVGTGRRANIAPEDEGRVIAAIPVNTTPRAGKNHQLYGPPEMDHRDVAEALLFPRSKIKVPRSIP